jgi:alpha-D-ribose 1-methylphosphonate 5-triphosphate synthase subunit PhnG
MCGELYPKNYDRENLIKKPLPRNHVGVTKQSWTGRIKLSIKLDNLEIIMSSRHMPDSASQPESHIQKRRQAAMAVLAHSDTAAIAERLAALAVPVHDSLREPENGLVMVRGRIGGDGAPFNLGEATISRAAVRLASGEVGFGYTLGRDRQKAELIALCDAMIQTQAHAEAVEAQVVAPLLAQMIAARRERAAETAATRVDFYTLVRGEG